MLGHYHAKVGEHAHELGMDGIVGNYFIGGAVCFDEFIVEECGVFGEVCIHGCGVVGGEGGGHDGAEDGGVVGDVLVAIEEHLFEVFPIGVWPCGGFVEFFAGCFYMGFYLAFVVDEGLVDVSAEEVPVFDGGRCELEQFYAVGFGDLVALLKSGQGFGIGDV